MNGKIISATVSELVEVEDSMKFEDGVVVFVDGYKIVNIGGYNGLWETAYLHKFKSEFVDAVHSNWVEWLVDEIGYMVDG